MKSVLICLACLAVLAFLTWRAWPASPVTTPADIQITPWEDGRGPTRIVAFGTSLTAGNAWPEGLAAALNACLDHPVEIQRVAAPGVGTLWAMEEVNRVIALNPGLVLIELAINDADILDGVPLKRSVERHDQLLEQLQQGLPDARLLLMTMSPVSGALRHLQRPYLEEYYAAYRLLARKHAVGLADLTPRWHTALKAGLPPPPDGLHPTDTATAQVVVPVLTAMIGKTAGATCSGKDS